MCSSGKLLPVSVRCCARSVGEPIDRSETARNSVERPQERRGQVAGGPVPFRQTLARAPARTVRHPSYDPGLVASAPTTAVTLQIPPSPGRTSLCKVSLTMVCGNGVEHAAPWQAASGP